MNLSSYVCMFVMLNQQRVKLMMLMKLLLILKLLLMIKLLQLMTGGNVLVTLADDWWQCSGYSAVFLFTTQSSGSRARTCGQSASHTSPETRIYQKSGTVHYRVQCTVYRVINIGIKPTAHRGCCVLTLKNNSKSSIRLRIDYLLSEKSP